MILRKLSGKLPKNQGFVMVVLAMGGALGFGACDEGFNKANTSLVKDRERETSASQIRDFREIEGNYITAKGDQSGYRMKAEFTVMRIVNDNTYLPSPTITGRFLIETTAAKRNENMKAEPLSSEQRDILNRRPSKPSVFSFKKGTYDPAGGDFAARIESEMGSGIDIACKRRDEAPGTSRAQIYLECSWIPRSSSEPKFGFQLVKIN